MKVTEAGGGSCSQTKPLPAGRHKGLTQCDGDYCEQTNPVNGETARCALSARGIRYWKYIPRYSDLDRDKDYEPCPFAGPAYQYTRNVLASGQWAQKKYKQERAALGLVYVDEKPSAVADEVVDPASEWGQFVARLRSDALVAVRQVSYQRLLETWCPRFPEDESLARLAERSAEGVSKVG